MSGHAQIISKTQAFGLGLLVRVKRKRDDPASESLCVVSSSESGGGGLLRGLNINTVTRPLKRVLLTRVDTLEQNSQLPDVLPKRPLKRRLDEVMSTGEEASIKTVLLLRDKRKVALNSAAPFILVDMNQVATSAEINVNSAEINVGGGIDNFLSENKNSVNRIVDPITRQLGPAIHRAFTTRKMGDIQMLIDQKIDVNYTNESLEGRTALMMAAMCCNKPLISKLLLLGADIMKVDKSGNSALDYARNDLLTLQAEVDVRHSEAIDVVLLLQAAMVTTIAERNMSRTSEADGDFVYDLYTEVEIEGATDGIKTFVGPYVQVPGMVVGDDGCELVFEYTEDWSDLGDDEDPDSNDERFAGNDYPEDEDSVVIDAPDEGEYEYDSDEQEHQQQPTRFERRGVGHVFMPYARDDPLLPVTQIPGGVRRLWGLNNEEDDDDGGEDDRGRRLDQMKLASGMKFGANVSEFDAKGLAKYGTDLSDDEPDATILRGAYDDGRGWVSKDTVAYDSDLDRSNDAEEDDEETNL
jgi:hypothetical protein